jgi:hypothetical protein
MPVASQDLPVLSFTMQLGGDGDDDEEEGLISPRTKPRRRCHCRHYGHSVREPSE